MLLGSSVDIYINPRALLKSLHDLGYLPVCATAIPFRLNQVRMHIHLTTPLNAPNPAKCCPQPATELIMSRREQFSSNSKGPVQETDRKTADDIVDSIQNAVSGAISTALAC